MYNYQKSNIIKYDGSLFLFIIKMQAQPGWLTFATGDGVRL